MKFKESPYYDKDLLGEVLYKSIDNDDEILTVHEYFEINDKEKEYIKKDMNIRKQHYNYKLVIYGEYYELDCQEFDANLYLIFDKPLHITGRYCKGIIAPEIFIKDEKNVTIHECIANKLTINNNYNDYYEITYSKIKNVCFHNLNIMFWYSQIDNFFIFDKNLVLANNSKLLQHHKIKCFGLCDDLRKKMLNDASFKKRTIHIE